MTRLVDCNGNYIGIGIYITKNTKYCNVMLRACLVDCNKHCNVIVIPMV